MPVYFCTYLVINCTTSSTNVSGAHHTSKVQAVSSSKAIAAVTFGALCNSGKGEKAFFVSRCTRNCNIEYIDTLGKFHICIYSKL